MMYRLLKDLIDWKCNLYIKCKLEKFRYATISSPVFLSLLLLVSLDLVHCSSLSNNVQSGRTLYEHGIFRHDRPWDSISPPRGDSDSNNEAAHHNSDYSPTIPPPDNRDKYTYDRFKRSVTTLNFHPKPKNHSASGLKPLRIFRYVTEDDVLQGSGASHSEAHHHQTIFRPFMKNESDHSGAINHSARVVGGAKVNLKAKLDKDDKKENSKKNKSDQVIRKSSSDSLKKEANHQNDSTGDSELKSQPKIIPTPSRPENILIFKPSLAIRKNKTSLIPSGKFAKSNNALTQLNQMSNGVSNSITAAISTKPQQQQQQEQSTDPNSSTVNDRSLIHNYFDSVVVLNEEEGQKQLLRQGSYYREKTSNSADVVDNGVGSGGDDEDEDDAIKNTMSEAHSPHPPTSDGSSFSFTSVLSPNSNAATRGSRGSSVDEMKNLITAENKNNSPSSPIMRNSTNGSLVEIHRTKMNGTITGNRDRVIVKVVKKGRKSRQRNGLAEDDGAQDGSERSRRSPFKVHPRFQQNGNRHAQINVKGGSEQLARAALFRRNTAIMMTPRMRQLNPAMTKKIAVAPRIITTSSSGPFARTIIPMQPIPVMQVAKKSVGPARLTFMPSGGGPIGPGPVGPPLAAIKVMPLTQNNKNIFIQQTPVTNPSAPPLPVTPSKDMMAGASKTVYNFRPFPEGLVLNQAASSYYSPTYRKFQKGFEDQITNIMDGGKELEDTVNTWEESRPPRRHHRHHHSRPRSRSSARHHRHHRNHRPRHEPHRHTHHHHSPHRSGAHSQHPHHRQPTARGKKLSNPKYTYPKNAESIQDILNYFEKDVPPQPRSRHHEPPERSGPMSPKRQQSSLPSSHDPPGPAPSYTKMADLSGEFRDVHASLLKDIKEFAKRPNMFSSSSDNYARHHQNHRKSNSRDSMEGSGFFFDPIDEIFNPQPKPVRDMIKQNHKNHDYDIKPDLYSLENIRERIALKRGKLGARQKDKDHGKDTHSFQFDPPHTDNEEDYYDNHRPSKHTTSEGGYSGEHVRNFNSKEDYDIPSTFKKNHYDKDSGDDSQPLFPNAQYKESSFSSAEWKAIQDAEFAAKTHHITSSTRKPIVLKRPTESFRKEQVKNKKKADREYFWNTLGQSPTTLNLDSPLVLKSPQAPTVLHPFSYSTFQTHAAAAAAAAQAMKPVSEEEDIVEIHTGGPGMSSASGVPSYTTDSHHMKQERLKKMYMDVLQQKLQLEAALLQPQALPSTLQHPGMHTSSSLLPQLSQLQQHHQLQQHQQQIHQQQLQQQLHQQHQHSHLQMPRVSMAPQLSGYSPSTIVTQIPLTGMGLTSPRRKKPMRMKIHIYPNGNEGIEQGIEAANLLAAGGFGTSGFSASNPPPSVVAPPPHQDMNKMSESAIPSGPTGPHPTSPSGFGATAPMPQTVGSAVKNKNVVLHLHVHRRNDHSGPLELETEGSSPVAVTAMPPKLTYKQIYDEQMKSEHHHNLQNHRMAEEEEERSLLNSSPQEGQESQNPNHHHHHHHEQDEEEDVDVERDKSISMEAPIHDDKIENVFHTIMKLRKRPASDVGSTAEDNRNKRNRN